MTLLCLSGLFIGIMTILSKKKTLQGKQEVEVAEATPHHGGSISIPLGALPNHAQVK